MSPFARMPDGTPVGSVARARERRAVRRLVHKLKILGVGAGGLMVPNKIHPALREGRGGDLDGPRHGQDGLVHDEQ